MQFCFNLLLKKEFRIGNKVTHFNKVVEGKLCDGVRIRLADIFKVGNDLVPIILVSEHQVAEDSAILKACIHSLPIEWNDGMSGISDQQCTVTGPWPTPYRSEY